MAEAAAVAVPPSKSMASVLSMAAIKACFPNAGKHAFTEVCTLAFMDTYAQRLTHAMELARVTDRAKLADALGISVQAVGQALAGQTRALSAENSAKAARFLKVDHHWLATGEGEPRPPGPSEQAIAFAREWDKLNTTERRRWTALLAASRDGVSDEVVEERMPITRKKERET
jgi:transcriptional regulator with XRE-family HTH domain